MPVGDNEFLEKVLAQTVYITLMLDAEDFVSPTEADAVREVANLLTDLGLKATFCIVGELVRRWDTEGRSDVIRALEPHDIGLHTDLHSVHPTTCEELERRGWSDGVEAMLRRERPGVEAIMKVFARLPSCWGGAGNTWGPQVCEALRELSVSSYVYACTSPGDSDVHEYRGMLAFGSGLHLGEWALLDEEKSQKMLSELHARLTDRSNSGAEWCEIFVGHPCVLRSTAFWDQANFGSGRNTAPEDWVAPPLRPEKDYRIMLVRLRRALEQLASRRDLEFATIGEMLCIASGAERIRLTREETEQWKREVTERLTAMGRWPIHKPDLDMRRIIALTLEAAGTVKRLRLP